MGMWELGPSTQMGNPQKEWGPGQGRALDAHEPTFRTPHQLVPRACLTRRSNSHHQGLDRISIITHRDY